MKLKKNQKNDAKILTLALLVILGDWLLQYCFRESGWGVPNLGISFGLASEAHWFWKTLIPWTLIGLGVYWIVTKTKPSVFLVCLWVGGVGNVVPRIFWGSVWDYININYLGLWVNLSDLLITISVLSYILMADETKCNIRRSELVSDQ